MKLKFFSPRWGFEKVAWEPFLQSVKEAGYAGIEWFPYGESTDPAQVIRLLEQYELEFCIVMAVLQPFDSFDAYLHELEKQLRALCRMGVSKSGPLFISAQTGREYFTPDQVNSCLNSCYKISAETGVPIYQETHRNKWSYAAHAVGPFLDQHPDLLLTFDISHWFCVSESYLHDQQAIVQKAIAHTRHIHARVGHTQGPQVWDPAAQEYAEALQEHLKVWDSWIGQMKKSGAACCTITPEFGPPPYLVFANRSGTPQDEQWRLNLWMKDLLQKRYAHI